MKIIWNIGTRQIQGDLDGMQFDSDTPWRKSEIAVLRSIPAIREVGSQTPRRIAIAPAYPSVKQTAIDAVLAVVIIHEEGVCAN